MALTEHFAGDPTGRSLFSSNLCSSATPDEVFFVLYLRPVRGRASRTLLAGCSAMLTRKIDHTKAKRLLCRAAD